MKLSINGNTVEVPDNIRTVSELLQHFKLEQKVAVVERNREILEKKDHPTTEVRDGDVFEIVHFVGGG
jgi:sulfur carrier protein